MAKRNSEQQFWEAARGGKAKKPSKTGLIISIVFGVAAIAGGGVVMRAFVIPTDDAPAAATPRPTLTATAAAATPAGPQPVTGPATVLDAGTLTVGDRKFQLQGVNFPGASFVCPSDVTEYRCGETGRRVLASFVGGAPVTCITPPAGAVGSTAVATCRTARGLDLASLQVEAGYAVGAKGSYAAEQARAQAKEAGLWMGGFAKPELWDKVAGR